jgi:hypothetical protein
MELEWMCYIPVSVLLWDTQFRHKCEDWSSSFCQTCQDWWQGTSPQNLQDIVLERNLLYIPKYWNWDAIRKLDWQLDRA